MSSPQHYFYRLLIITLVPLLFTLIVVESAFRILMSDPPWLYRTDHQENSLMMEHEARGYALRANFRRSWSRRDFDINVAINERGLRDDDFGRAQGAQLRVLAAGDSYTFGIGVEARDTFAEQLEQMLQRRLVTHTSAAVVNAGVPGYSARQIRIMIEELWADLSPQVVIFGMYASSYWRVEDPFVLHGPALVTSSRASATVPLKDNVLISTLYPSDSVLRGIDLWLKQHFYVGAYLLSLPNKGRHVPHRDARSEDAGALGRAYRPVLRELALTHEFLRARGSVLIVLAINAQEPNGAFAEVESRYNAIMRVWCRENNVSFIDPLPVMKAMADKRLRFRHVSDPHWSREAHQVAAALLLKWFEDGGWLSQSLMPHGQDGKVYAVRPEVEP
jgi:hypothetical protein